MSSFAQSTIPLRADKVRIYKEGGFADLQIENSTKDTLGVAVNIGNGLLRFIKSRKINDTTIVVGFDTLNVGAGTGAGAEDIDTTSMARANSKLFSRVPVFTSYASMRTVATNDLSTGYVYKTLIEGIQREWRYDATDSSTPDDTAMTIVTSSGKRFKALVADGWINVKWFGAKGDNITDDTYNIQRAIDWVLANYSTYRVLYLPAGRYKTTNGLVVWRDADSNGFPDFVNIDIVGDAFPYGFDQSTVGGTTIHATHKDNFALGIQFGKGCRVSNIAFEGENDVYDLHSPSTIYSGNSALWVKTGVRDNNKSPYSAIVIDPFHFSTPTGDRYPRMDKYYDDLVNTSTTGSTDIIIKDFFIEKFLAGVICSPNGTSQNAEVIKLQDGWIQFTRDAVCNAQSQTRQNEVINLKVWGGVHTIFNSTTYGQGNGVLPNVVGLNVAGYNYQLLKLTSGWSGGSFTNIYSELMFRLGTWGTGLGSLPVSFVNCYFDIPSTLWYTSSKFIGNEAVFIGSTIRQYNSRTGFITTGGNNLTFINCQLSGPVVNFRDVASLINHQKAIGKVKYINCNTYANPLNKSGMVTSELYENSIRHDNNRRSIFGVQFAWIKPQIFGNVVHPTTRERLELSYEYGLNGETNLTSDLASKETGRTINFNSNGTATFKSATPDQYLVNDILSQSGITATIDGDASVSSTILGVVTNIAADSTITVSSVPDFNTAGTQKTNVTVFSYWQNTFMEPVVGNVTSGSNVITGIHYTPRASEIRVGTPVVHPLFPFYTRVTAIDLVNKTLTVSKNATASETQSEIAFTRLNGRGTAKQNPSTINFTPYVATFDTLNALVMRGSFMENVGSDTTILGWLCTKTGFLNTTMPPEFKVQYFHDKRYDNPFGYNYNPPLSALSDTDFVTKQQLINEIATTIPNVYMNPDQFLPRIGDEPYTIDTSKFFTQYEGDSTNWRVDSVINALGGIENGVDSVTKEVDSFRVWKNGSYTALKDSIGEGGSGIPDVNHDATLVGNGDDVPLGVDTSAGKIASQYMIKTVAVIAGLGISVQEVTDDDGNKTFQVINTGSPGSNPMNALDLRTFGAQSDWTGSGTAGIPTGTDNTPFLQAAINSAASGQWIIAPAGAGGAGYAFKTPLDTITGGTTSQNKRVYLLFLADICLGKNDFIRIKNQAGAYEQHRIIFKGNVLGRTNEPSQNYANYIGGTGPDWANYTTGVVVKIINANQNYIEFNKATATRAPIELIGSDGAGSQENTIIGAQFNANRYGILLTSLDGSSFIDKNFFGGLGGGRNLRIGGQYPLYIDGYSGTAGNGETYNGAFRSNEFHFLIENADELPFAMGDITEPWFDITVEGGTQTGVLNASSKWGMKITSPNYVRNPRYTGGGVLGAHRLGTGSTGSMGVNGTIEIPIWAQGSTAYYGHSAEIDGSGNIWVNCPPTTSQTVRSAAPGYIKFRNTSVDDDFVSITASTYTVATNVNRVKFNNSNGTVTLGSPSATPKKKVTIFNLHANDLDVAGTLGTGVSNVIKGNTGTTYWSDGAAWWGEGDGGGGGGGSDSLWDVDANGIHYSGNVGIRKNAKSNAAVAFPASTTSIASLNEAAGVAPTAPADGDMWNDNEFRFIQLGGVTYKYMMVPDGGGVKNQIIEVNDAADGFSFRHPPYKAAYTMTTPINASGNGSGAATSLIDGIQTLDHSLAVGDKVEIKGDGTVTTDVASTNLSFRLIMGGTTLTIPINSLSSSSFYNYTYSVTMIPTATGTNAACLYSIKVSVYLNGGGNPINYVTSGQNTLNTVSPNFNYTAYFSNANNLLTAHISTLEVFRQ